MAGKYEEFQARLLNLQCCIADKALRIKEAMDQQAPDLDCRIWELEVLSAYYDALKCHYPYDCRDVYTYTGTQATTVWTLTNLEAGAEVGGTYTFCGFGIEMIGDSSAGDPTHTIVGTGAEGVISLDFDDMVQFIIDSINNNPNNNSLLGGPYTAALTGGTPGLGAEITITGGQYCDTNDHFFKFDIQYTDDLGVKTLEQGREYLTGGTCDTVTITEECCNFKHVTSASEYELVTEGVNPSATWTFLSSEVESILSCDSDKVIQVLIYADDAVCGGGAVFTVNYDAKLYGTPPYDANEFYTWLTTAVNNQHAIGNIDYTISGVTINNPGDPGETGVFTLEHHECNKDTCARIELTSADMCNPVRVDGTFSGGTCPEYATVTNPIEQWICMDNCLTDAQVESILCHVNKLCDCDC